MKMKKKLDYAVAIAALALVVVGGAVAYRAAYQIYAERGADSSGEVAVAELITISREGGGVELRRWLKTQGPDNAHRVILRLDNANDTGAVVRMEVLRAIDSLGSEGLSDDATRSWALVLRSLANGVLHDGPDRSDFIARSYVMEGRLEAAAGEYQRFPTSPAAANFFGAHPDARTPASTK